MKKWVKTENLLAEPDGGEPRPKFGVYRFDDDSFYLGEFDDYKRNGMGMQSLEDGDYFFGYFGDNQTKYPYVHFSMEDDYLEIVFEKDYYTNTERYLKITLNNGEFFYGQRRDDVDIGFGFRLSYPDEHTPNLKYPWVSIDYYGKDGELEDAGDVISVPDNVISNIFREPFSLIEPTPMFMAHPLESVDGFEYRAKTYGDGKYHSYYMENSGSSEYGSGIGIFSMPNFDKNQDRFVVSEFLNGSMCGWQFEHAVDGSKRDRLIYENRNGKYFIFENNLGLGGGIEIIFPQNWSPAIKYETNGYLYIVQTESKGYPSFSGPGLRLDITNGELIVVNFIERKKFTYQKYYHLKHVSGSYWEEAEGKKLFKSNETGHFTNYIETHPEYYTIRHPFTEEPKSMDTSDTSAKSSGFEFNSSTRSSASSSEKDSSLGSSSSSTGSRGMQKWTLHGEKKNVLAESTSDAFGIKDYGDNRYYIGHFKDGHPEGLGVVRFEKQTEFCFYYNNKRYRPNCVYKNNNSIDIRLGFDKDGFERVLYISFNTGKWAYYKADDKGNPKGQYRYIFVPDTGKILVEDLSINKTYEYDNKLSLGGKFIVKGEPAIFPVVDLDDFNYRGADNDSYSKDWIEENSSDNRDGVGVLYREEREKVEYTISQFKNHKRRGWVFHKRLSANEVALYWLDDNIDVKFKVYFNENGETYVEANNVMLREYNGYLYYTGATNGVCVNIDDSQATAYFGKYINSKKQWNTSTKWYVSNGIIKNSNVDNVHDVLSASGNIVETYFTKNPNYLSDHKYLYEVGQSADRKESSSSSSSFKASSSSSSGPEITSCFGRDLDLEVPEFVQDVELRNFPRGNKYTGYAYQGKPMIGWVTLHNGDMFYANFHNAKFRTPLRKNLGVFIHFTSKYDYRVYVFKDTGKWQHIDYDNIELTTNNVMGALAPKEYENAAENGYFVWDSEESHTYLLTNSQRYGQGKDLGYFPHAFPDTNEQTLGELSFADMEAYHTKMYKNAVYFGEDNDTVQGGMGDMYVENDGTILYGRLNSDKSGVHVKGYGYKLITGSYLQVGWLKNDGKVYLDDYGVLVIAGEGLWAGIFKDGNTDYNQDYLYIGANGRVSYRANGELFETNIGTTSFEILCNELFAKRILESCLHKESEFIDRLVRNIDFESNKSDSSYSSSAKHYSKNLTEGYYLADLYDLKYYFSWDDEFNKDPVTTIEANEEREGQDPGETCFSYMSSASGVYGSYSQSSGWMEVHSELDECIYEYFSASTMRLCVSGYAVEIDTKSGTGFIQIDRNGKWVSIFSFDVDPKYCIDLSWLFEDPHNAVSFIQVIAFYGHYPLIKDIIDDMATVELLPDHIDEKIWDIQDKFDKYLGG